MTTPQMDWLDDQRRRGVLGAGFYGPTEGEKRRRRNATWPPPTDAAWRAMCGDRVRAGQWTGEVVAQNGAFSWVLIDGIGVPQTHATVTLSPAPEALGTTSGVTAATSTSGPVEGDHG